MTTDLTRLEKQLTSIYHTWTITTPHYNGCKIKTFLQEKLPHIATESWERRMQLGGLYINGVRIQRDEQIVLPARIEYFEPKFDIDYPHKFFPAFKSEYILYEDEDIIVFFKPAKLPSVCSRDQIYFSAKQMLEDYCKQILHLPSRLDNSAQGVMVVSKSSRMNHSLQRAFENKQVAKTYRLLVSGGVSWTEKKVENRLDRSLLHPVLRQVVPEGGKKACTHFSVMGNKQENILLQANPITGRTHQIRVHSAHLQAPIVGDYFYGGLPFPTLCLLSYEIKFYHAFQEKWLTVNTPDNLMPQWAILQDSLLRNVIMRKIYKENFMNKFIFIAVLCCTAVTFADLGPQHYTSSPPKTAFEHMDFVESATFNRDELTWKAQNKEWREKMSQLGQTLLDNDVKSVYFVHGTFVGNDPFGTVEYLKKMYPDMSPELEQALLDLIKHSNDLILEDTANFTPQYAKLFSHAVQNKIPCHRYEWSSGSYHWARVKSAILLTKSIAEEISRRSEMQGKRILLVGHSHAGQLFALLSNFLENAKGVDKVMAIANEGGVDVSQMENWLQQIRKVKLDIVTYGTPPLYGWGKGDYRLLNIINHRGEGHLAGELKLDDILYTTAGDYIQQIGITGSGSESYNSWEQELNEKLYPLLGVENDEEQHNKNIAHRMRIPHYGKTLLVDFKDAGGILPNCITTLFGHGVNTRYEKMLFNTQTIVNRFYSK